MALYVPCWARTFETRLIHSFWQIITWCWCREWSDLSSWVQEVLLVISTCALLWGKFLTKISRKLKKLTTCVTATATKCFWTCSICPRSSSRASTSHRFLVKWSIVWPSTRTAWRNRMKLKGPITAALTPTAHRCQFARKSQSADWRPRAKFPSELDHDHIHRTHERLKIVTCFV